MNRFGSITRRYCSQNRLLGILCITVLSVALMGCNQYSVVGTWSGTLDTPSGEQESVTCTFSDSGTAEISFGDTELSVEYKQNSFLGITIVTASYTNDDYDVYENETGDCHRGTLSEMTLFLTLAGKPWAVSSDKAEGSLSYSVHDYDDCAGENEETENVYGDLALTRE